MIEFLIDTLCDRFDLFGDLADLLNLQFILFGDLVDLLDILDHCNDPFGCFQAKRRWQGQQVKTASIAMRQRLIPLATHFMQKSGKEWESSITAKPVMAIQLITSTLPLKKMF